MNNNNYKIAGASDVGVSRQNNEDSMTNFDSGNGYVVAVCDGMGGENGGETASNITVSIIEDIIKNNQFGSPNEAIVSATNAANKAVLRRASMYPALEGMGSTCVMAIINNGKVYYGSIGDSRIYYFDKNNGLIQLTKDQSYVQLLVDSGEITAEEAEQHPRKNEILNAIGLDGMTPAVVCDTPLSPQPGGILLLCSDGLTGMVPDSTIQHVLGRSELSLDDKVKKLISLANEAGGLDNITLQLVEFSGVAKVAPRPELNNEVEQSAPPKAKGKVNKGWLAALVIFALALGGGGFYYYMSQDEPKKEESPKSETKTEKKDKPKTIEAENKDAKSKPESSSDKKTVTIEKKVETRDVTIKKEKEPKTKKTTLEKKLTEEPPKPVQSEIFPPQTQTPPVDRGDEGRK